MKKKPKIKPHELADLLHNVFEKERSIRIKKQQKLSKLRYGLRKAITIPIVIGFAAAIVMWYVYGWDMLSETLLSWTIGSTILVSIIALLKRIDRI